MRGSESGGRRKVRKYAGLLVRSEHGDPSRVSFFAAVGRRHEDLDEARGLVLGVHARANRDDVRVIVLPGELCDLLTPGQGGPDSCDLVRCNRFAVARSANDDAQAVRVGADPGGRAQDIRRIVIVAVVLVRTAVDRLVAGRLKPADEVGLQLESGVVGTDVDTHGRQSATSSGNSRISPLEIGARDTGLTWHDAKTSLSAPVRRATPCRV